MLPPAFIPSPRMQRAFTVDTDAVEVDRSDVLGLRRSVSSVVTEKETEVATEKDVEMDELEDDDHLDLELSVEPSTQEMGAMARLAELRGRSDAPRLPPIPDEEEVDELEDDDHLDLGISVEPDTQETGALATLATMLARTIPPSLPSSSQQSNIDPSTIISRGKRGEPVLDLQSPSISRSIRSVRIIQKTPVPSPSASLRKAAATRGSFEKTSLQTELRRTRDDMDDPFQVTHDPKPNPNIEYRKKLRSSVEPEVQRGKGKTPLTPRGIRRR
jgi:hypothetical protein